MAAWLNQLYETFIESGHLPLIFEGFKNTLVISAGACVIGVLIGFVIATIKFFAEDSKAFFIPAKICDFYVTAVRGIPVVVLLLLFYFVFMISSDNGVIIGIITFGVNSGAYVAELIRSGIRAVDPGQNEAGRSLGLSRMQTMIRIVLPQAVRHILPAICNEFIALLKETAVVGYVAVVDLTRAGNLIRNNTFDAVNPLALVALIYLGLVILITKLLSCVEKRMSYGQRKG